MIRKKYLCINRYLGRESFGVAVCVNSDRFKVSYVSLEGKSNSTYFILLTIRSIL